MECGSIKRLPQFFEYPQLSQERVKLRTSNFVRAFFVSIGTKVHYNFWKSSLVRSEDSQNFSVHPYIGRIERSSLQSLSCLVFVSLSRRPDETPRPIATLNGSYDAVSAKKVPFGVSMTKNNVWGQNPQKRKFWGAGIGILGQICKIFKWPYLLHEILQEHPQPLSKDDEMLKIDTRSKFKMVAAAILKSLKRP